MIVKRGNNSRPEESIYEQSAYERVRRIRLGGCKMEVKK